ncbi:MAG TPA: hypothetical protein VFT43_10630 [Candidatus Polarisedimenticolia bacterium]|nr:hypothetical protein [Candidatus Polarisedimenticolia bacterium]
MPTALAADLTPDPALRRARIDWAALLLGQILFVVVIGVGCARAGRENPSPTGTPTPSAATGATPATVRSPDARHVALSITPLTEPFPAPAPGSVGETSLAGDTIATIDDGDFAYPRLSPDGSKVAYSRVVVQGTFENTEVLVLDLATHKTSTLLDAAAAEKYATYKTFVYALAWPDRDHVRASLSDGDVDSTHLIFDVHTRAATEPARSGEDDEEMPPPLSPELARALERTRAVVSDLPEEVLEGAFRNNPILVEDRAVILQKSYAGYDENVLQVDFASASATPLVRLADGSGWHLKGGIPLGETVLFLLEGKSKSNLFAQTGDKVKILAELAGARGGPQLEPKWRSPGKAIFEIKAHETYERGDNPLFVFDGKRLARVTDYAELYDADIDAPGRTIAFCYWKGDARHIAVRRLKE